MVASVRYYLPWDSAGYDGRVEPARTGGDGAYWLLDKRTRLSRDSRGFLFFQTDSLAEGAIPPSLAEDLIGEVSVSEFFVEETVREQLSRLFSGAPEGIIRGLDARAEWSGATLTFFGETLEVVIALREVILKRPEAELVFRTKEEVEALLDQCRGLLEQIRSLGGEARGLLSAIFEDGKEAEEILALMRQMREQEERRPWWKRFLAIR